MTPEQVDKILTVLQAEYPNSFSNMDERLMALKRNLWVKEFAADDFNLVFAAIRVCMKTGGAFAPNIGEIRQKMAMFTEETELPEHTAWAMVQKACQNGIYGYKKEFAKLPEAVQRAVGAPEQLRAWAMMDAETVNSVVASNFMRNYRTQQTRDHQLSLLPPEMRAMIGGVAAGMKQIGGSDDNESLREMPGSEAGYERQPIVPR